MLIRTLALAVVLWPVVSGMAMATEEMDRKYVRTDDGPRAVPLIAVDEVCAWPNLTLLPDGSIVAMIYNQASHLRRPGDVDCWASEDGGITWSKRGTPAPRETEQEARGNVAAGLAANGDLIVLVSGWSGPFDDRSRGEVLPVWISRSGDGGRTWAIDRTGFPKLPTGRDGVPYGDIVRGSDGTLRAALYRDSQTFIYRSFDDGRTWEEPVLLSADEPTNETALFHLGEGKWIAAARYAGLTLFSSIDDGATWSREGNLTAPEQHPGHLVRLGDGRLLLSYGNRVPPRGVDVQISLDGGTTWSGPWRVLDFERDGGYPSSVQLPGGEIVTAYYARRIEGHDQYHMGVVRWCPLVTGLPERK
jgi:hypothetical protein